MFTFSTMPTNDVTAVQRPT